MSVDSSPQRPPTAEPLLREVGDSDVSGVLEVAHPDESSSHVWLREGRVYALQVPGYRPALGIRLLSGGLVTPEQLSSAAVEQRERRPGQLIGEVLVGMRLVSPTVIDAFVREQVLDQAADLLDLDVSGASFHAGRHIRQGLTEPVAVDELLAAAAGCRSRRSQALARIGGADVVPTLGPPVGSPTHTPLGPYDWALLCRVDGSRDVTELARVCGFTVVEAAQIVADLSTTGLLELPPLDTGDTDSDLALAPILALPNQAEPTEPEWSFQGTDAGEPDPVPPGGGAADIRSELLSEFGALLTDDTSGAQGEPPTDVLPPATDDGPAPDLEVGPPAGLDSGPTDELVEDPPTQMKDSAPSPEPPAGGSTELPAPSLDPGDHNDNDPGAPLGPHNDDQPGPEEAPAPGDEPTLALVGAGAPQTPEPTGSGQAAAADPGPHAPLSGLMPDAAPASEEEHPAGPDSDTDTTAFMRELSSLSDDPEESEPVVTRLVVPLKEQRRKRRLWGR